MKKAHIWSVLVGAAIFAALAMWVIRQARHTEMIMLDDGTLVADVPASDIPSYAGDEDRGLRKAYLERLETFKAWPIAEVDDPRPAEVAKLVDPLIRSALRDQTNGHHHADVLDEHHVVELSRLVGRIVAAMSGATLDDYVGSMPDGATFRTPNYPPAFDYMAEYHLGRPVLDANAATEAWREMFDLTYAYNQKFAGGQNRVNGVVADHRGFRVIVEKARDNILRQLLPDHLSTEESQLLFGVGNQAMPICFSAPGGLALPERFDTETLQASAVFVVQNESGDRYPVSLLAYYDTSTRAWWPLSIYRGVSLRAMSSPFFAF